MQCWKQNHNEKIKPSTSLSAQLKLLLYLLFSFWFFLFPLLISCLVFHGVTKSTKEASSSYSLYCMSTKIFTGLQVVNNQHQLLGSNEWEMLKKRAFSLKKKIWRATNPPPKLTWFNWLVIFFFAFSFLTHILVIQVYFHGLVQVNASKCYVKSHSCSSTCL